MTKLRRKLGDDPRSPRYVQTVFGVGNPQAKIVVVTHGAGIDFLLDGAKDKNGNVIVEKDKRITARHVRQLEQGGAGFISVPEDFLVGRVVARNMVDPETGEIVAKANDELTEALLKKLRAAGVKEIQCLFTNELNQGAYISQTLASDETADQLAARVAQMIGADVLVLLSDIDGLYTADPRRDPAARRLAERQQHDPAAGVGHHQPRGLRSQRASLRR